MWTLSLKWQPIPSSSHSRALSNSEHSRRRRRPSQRRHAPRRAAAPLAAPSRSSQHRRALAPPLLDAAAVIPRPPAIAASLASPPPPLTAGNFFPFLSGGWTKRFGSNCEMMGHKKRKGKEQVVEEPRKKKKKTQAQKEAEKAQAVADAAERAERGGAGGSLQIGGQRRSTRTRQQAPPQTATPPSTARSREGRPRTRGGATPSAGWLSQDKQPQEQPRDPPHTGPQTVTASEDIRLFDLRNRKTKGIKALRYDMTVDEFYPRPRDFRIDRQFWTVLQASLYESALQGGHRLMPHAAIDFDRANSVSGHNIRRYFEHYPGLVDLMARSHKYVEDWVRVFSATLYVAD
ncbi:hypothetical protein U9M48_038720 [Paspalum notatum var. saurae]|uniref:Uncharacterized protein n=1 Tax=Paspalum notatum var. saurae TaxID=547442 RepID=A0AAQ3UJ51_PASNO